MTKKLGDIVYQPGGNGSALGSRYGPSLLQTYFTVIELNFR